MTLTDQELYLLEKPAISCADFEESLYEYFEGELSPVVEEKLSGHRDICECCAQSFEDYQLTVQLAAEFGELRSNAKDFDENADEQLPEEVEERLYSALRERLGVSLFKQ